MNSLTQVLLWCPIQVTVLALAGLVIGTIAGRRRPAAGALVAVAALLAVVGLTVTALAPWPAWSIPSEGWFSRHAVAQRDRPAVVAVSSRSPAMPRFAGDESADTLAVVHVGSTSTPKQADSVLARSWATFNAHWFAILGGLYLVGVAAMLLRVALGLLAVRDYRRHSQSIADRELGELLDVVRAKLGCARPIELRETARLITPATVGCRLPLLLLPSNWRDWNEQERLAVLAHEVEHVRRNDFASWMAAQIGLALHFYHPLVHGLASRLRLQQELAADTAAARLVGGQRKYVTTLAAMALRQSDSPVAWPARAFLPTSKTFLRRIEMLHRSKSLRGDASRTLASLSVAAVVLAALCAAGIRGSAVAQQSASSGTTGENGASSGTVAQLDKAAQPPAAEAPPRNAFQDRAQLVRTINQIKQLALAMHNYYSAHQHFPPAAVLGPDGKTLHSWRVELLPYLEAANLYNQYDQNQPWDSEKNKKVLAEMPDVLRSPFNDEKSTSSGYYVLVGPGTVFEAKSSGSSSTSSTGSNSSSSSTTSSNDGITFQEITDGTSNTLLIVESKRNVPWTKPEDIAFDPEKPMPELGGFVKGQFVGALADGRVLRFSDATPKDQLKWLILRNDGHPIDIGTMTLNQGRAALGSPRRRMPLDRATQSQQNLKLIGLAMHNYHDIHSHFPPAVVMGPDGKTPHSWRVELLQMLGPDAERSKQNVALYKQYRLDEPWDSENNKQLLAQIPEPYRSPYDDPKSTNSGYFALVGPGTMFEGSEGIPIRDVTDGTSNTLMFVEAKRNIPWTKPEDIPFDVDKLPELGGFQHGRFFAAFADGSVRLLETDQVKDQLNWMIMRNDGHPIVHP